ncbi:MAG: sterol desaturase family protein [Deltaproteobacteria bacterium]|nr:sterol desaturase family protein [Deltaproteobacteria bacterium]
MSTLVYLAVPAFLLLICIEYGLSRSRAILGYEGRDTAASLAMGIANVSIAALTKAATFGIYVFLHQFALFDIRQQWWALPAAILADDFAYYWFHRMHHEVRLLWAAHVNHHSSRRYNLSTALRQSWTTPFTGPVFWMPLALIGFDPLLIFTAQAISLVYQFWIHTELIDRMGPLEWAFNTPSHHRVHHGRNVEYLDRNHGGILILWDRLFGTFEAERASVDYGLTKNIHTYNPLKIAFHEWADMLGDACSAGSPGDAIRYLLRPPGWSPDGSTRTASELRTQQLRAQQLRAQQLREQGA